MHRGVGEALLQRLESVGIGTLIDRNIESNALRTSYNEHWESRSSYPETLAIAWDSDARLL
jgi:hypothetical protein